MNAKRNRTVVRSLWAVGLSVIAVAAIAQSRPESAGCVDAPAGMTRPGTAVPGCARPAQVADLLAQNGRSTDAFAWYLVAAQQGDTHAQERVGKALLPGGAALEGVAASYPMSMYWLGKAARAGDAEAQRTVVEIYRGTRDFGDR